MENKGHIVDLRNKSGAKKRYAYNIKGYRVSLQIYDHFCIVYSEKNNEAKKYDLSQVEKIKTQLQPYLIETFSYN